MGKITNKRKVYFLQFLWILVVIAAVIVILIGGKELLSILDTYDVIPSYGMSKDGDNEYDIDNYDEIEHKVGNIVYAAESNNTGMVNDGVSEMDENVNPDYKNNNENNNGNNDIKENNNGNNDTKENVNSSNDTKANINEENIKDGTDIDKSADDSSFDDETKPEDIRQNEDTIKDNAIEDNTEVKKLIALTFDDGPYESVTNRILDVLDKYNAKATFFVMGNRVLDYPTTLRRTFEEGHEIGNHTYSHKQLTKLNEKSIKYEIEYSNEMINQVIEVGDALLRPPYGDHNALVDKIVKVPMITWSIDSLDWKSKDKDKVIEQIKATLHENAIVLMHDLYESTADAIEELIPYLIKEGYELVTVSELFERNGMELEAGKVYRNAIKN